MEEDAMGLTEKLDTIMSEKKINKSELASGSGVPYTTIVGIYKKGYENIKLSTLKKLCNFLDCSIDYLVEEKTSPKENNTEYSEVIKSIRKYENIAVHKERINTIQKLIKRGDSEESIYELGYTKEEYLKAEVAVGLWFADKMKD